MSGKKQAKRAQQDGDDRCTAFFSGAFCGVMKVAAKRGYDPLCSAIAIFQTALLPLAHLDRATTALLVLAYVDAMQNPPGTAAYKKARRDFAAAQSALSLQYKAICDFPAPQGRA